MKKLLNYACAQAVSSFMPILMWILVGVVYGDSDYASVFTLTYPFQFVWCFIYSLLIGGCLVWETKYGKTNYDYTKSSIIWSFLLILVAAFFSIVNSDYMFGVLGITDYKYFYFYCFSLLCLCLNMVVGGVTALQQYEGEETRASLEMLKYYSLQVVTIVITGLILKDELLSIIVSLSILCIYSVYLFVKNIKPFRIKVNIFKGIKYKLPSMVSNVAMFVIYAFGLKSVVEVSALHLASYNLMALSTDTQWDSLGAAIETDTTIAVCSGTYFTRKKEMIKNAQWLSLILMASSFLMMLIGSMFFTVNLKYMLILALLEISTFPLYGLKYVYHSWLSVEHPGLPLVLISLSGYIVRVLVSFGVSGAYGLSLAVLLNSLYTNIAAIIYYKYKIRGRDEFRELY